MPKFNLRPALISLDGSRVLALELTDIGGILAIPVEKHYRDIGSVFQERIVIDGINAKRWFAETVVQSTLGPYGSRPLAINALVEWNHLRAASVAETSHPLF